MGMARQAPNDNYKRKYIVSPHAVSRLRERLHHNDVLTHRDDRDLSNYLDAAISAAWPSMEEVMDEGTPAFLVDCRGTLHQGLWAVLKADKSGSKQLVVVTLLTDFMVKKNKQTGQWSDGGASDGNPAPTLHPPGQLGKLGDKLGEQLLDVLASLPPPGSKPPPKAGPGSHPGWSHKKDPNEALPEVSVDTRLMSYLTVDNVRHYVEYPKTEITRRIEELYVDARVVRESIRIWRPVPTRIQVTMSEE